VSGRPAFSELVSRVKETTRTAYANQNVPFDMLIEKLHPDRDLSYHAPLAQVMFTLENLPLTQPDLPGLRADFAHIDLRVAGADLGVLIWPEGNGYRCDFEYSTDLFEEATIRQLQRHYLRLLEQVLADPGRRIDEYPLLTENERREVLTEWNQTACAGPGFQTVAAWFRAQVALRGNAIALEMGGRQLSYAELDALSDRVASALHRRGVGREVVVGLYVTRSVEMMVCLLGILKAGGAYLPLDPAFPAQRIEYLVRDSGVSLIVTEKSLLSSLPESGATVLPVEDLLAAEAGDMPGEQVRADDLAYLIYTSGSTGQPKGTEITHRSLVNLLDSMLREPGLDKQDTLVAVTTLSFDIAGLELFGPLVSGGKLVLASREQVLDPMALADLLERSEATVLQATPSTWRMLVESGWLGKPDLRMWCGGEALSAELADSLLTRGSELWNLYGPTETTIWSAAHRVSSGEDPILIGRPIANTRMYILDNHGEPLPVGANGELYIAGEGVARGYRDRVELTTERFSPEPFVAGERMYRTGDLARYRRDGQIQLLGRADQQIKLRGHRIELGEIEAALERHSSVQQAVVSVHGKAADQRLVAYVRLAAGRVESEDLRRWLLQRLPEYMVPGAYVVMEEFSLTPNGKVDRKLLPIPDEQLRERNAPAVAARNPTEQRVAAIWSDLLETKAVGMRENFFDLGGHSLLLVRVHARLRDEFVANISITDLFRFPTVESLAAHLIRQEESAVVEGVHP
jgi:amino acid adenylation domain-containing protein